MPFLKVSFPKLMSLCSALGKPTTPLEGFSFFIWKKEKELRLTTTEEKPAVIGVLDFHCFWFLFEDARSWRAHNADLGNFCLRFSNDPDELADETECLSLKSILRR